MNTIKKRALTSIAVCFMACLMFSMPVLAASNSFIIVCIKKIKRRKFYENKKIYSCIMF